MPATRPAIIGWLSYQQGYKSKISPSDAHYYKLSRGEERIAKADRDPVYPLMKQTLKAFDAMPCATEIEHRDKAVFAFLVMTGTLKGKLSNKTLGK